MADAAVITVYVNDALVADNKRLRAALQEIADAHPLPGAFSWCREMAIKALTPRPADAGSVDAADSSSAEPK
jgi:hypothetical protein